MARRSTVSRVTFIAGGAVLAVMLFVGVRAVRAQGTPQGAKFIGAKKCRLCHMNEYKTWSESKHAKNFDVLEGAERANPDCLKCHTTGYGKEGGFVSESETPDLTNAGCESCHGPGSEHADAAKKAGEATGWEKRINRVPQNVCVDCHNPHINQKKRAEELRKAS
jgi:hypothetical protein